MVQLKVSVTTDVDNTDLHSQAAKILQEEIDWEILADMFVKLGWIMIDLQRFHNNEEAVDVANWIEENCTGKHMHRGKTFVFENKQDAEWFTLRWS